MDALKTTPRLAIDNILFATDFSSTSTGALAFGLAVARWYGSKILAVHAVMPEPHYSVPLEPIPLDLEPLYQQAKKKMAECETTRAFGDVPHEAIIQHGQPWEVVARVTRQQRIDLLVLGTHGRTGIRKLVLGSQAEIIFRQATCPVVTVGPHVHTAPTESWNPKTVVFATDFSEASLHAFPFALSLAEETQATLILAHFMALVPVDRRDEAEADAYERLRKLIPLDAEQWFRPEFVVRVDFPAAGILNIAEEQKADLVVMGVRKRTLPGAAAHLPWATASEVVSRAPCPVLTVRG
ncbi:MAG TPA: universal stress protein [Terriglobales bacterium]|nr:universal stress protein [Terriglobales bacterium]